jgi:hypothetical protein
MIFDISGRRISFQNNIVFTIILFGLGFIVQKDCIRSFVVSLDNSYIVIAGLED